MESKKIKQFQKKVWKYYHTYGRHDLAWRHTRDPYEILVSEVMLQQTQVTRVEKYWSKFLKKFPTITSLARAPVSLVLKEWQGLGYNRRALYLKRAAEKVLTEYSGKFPKTLEELIELPGIGKNTAGAVLAYAWNKRVVFIETNIRSVFIHEFFSAGGRSASGGEKQVLVYDTEILNLVEQTCDTKNLHTYPIREWYWALMDYGVHIKEIVGNPNIKSRHYTKQSKFSGSLREARGKVLKLLGEKSFSRKELEKESNIFDGRIEIAIGDLIKEGFIKKQRNKFFLES